MTGDSTFGLAPARLTRLLAMGLGDTPDDVSIAAHLASLLQQPIASGGRQIGTILIDAQAALADVIAIKGIGRTLGEAADIASERQAAVCVYYAAIARALMAHGKKITGHTYGYLRKSLNEICTKPWVPAKLRVLFADAAKSCAGR